MCHGAACSASLTSLTLSHNPVADAGARSLAVSKVQPSNAACTPCMPGSKCDGFLDDGAHWTEPGSFEAVGDHHLAVALGYA